MWICSAFRKELQPHNQLLFDYQREDVSKLFAIVFHWQDLGQLHLKMNQRQCRSAVSTIGTNNVKIISHHGHHHFHHRVRWRIGIFSPPLDVRWQFSNFYKSQQALNCIKTDKRATCYNRQGCLHLHHNLHQSPEEMPSSILYMTLSDIIISELITTWTVELKIVEDVFRRNF